MVGKVAGASLFPVEVAERGQVVLWSLACDKIEAPVLSALRKALAADECTRADRFHFESDRTVYIAAHALLRVMLSGNVAHPAHFRVDAWGKPEIDITPPGIRFNLTHTRGLAACAIAQIDDIGVDAEAQDRSIDVLSLAGSFFATSETAYLRTLPETLRLSAFLRLWTLKEAFIKAVGKGLSIPLGDFAFTLEPFTFSCIPELGTTSDEWSFRSLSLRSSHYLAVALRRRQDEVMTLHHRHLTAEQLVPLLGRLGITI